MLEKTVYELLSEVIQGISSNLNKKALKEVIQHNPCSDYNELLKAYYDRVHRMKKSNYTFYEFVSINDFEDENEFKAFLKDNNMKWYKNKYNYDINNLQPIKQKNTGFIILVNNGYTTYGSYLFNVNEFIEYNKIEVIE